MSEHVQTFVLGTQTHVNYPAQCSYSIWSVYNIAANCRILHDTTGNHNDIVCGWGQLLEGKVHHLTKSRILILEELRDAKEQIGCFVPRKPLPGEEEENNLGQEDAAFPRGYGGCVEDSGYTLIN